MCSEGTAERYTVQSMEHCRADRELMVAVLMHQQLVAVLLHQHCSYERATNGCAHFEDLDPCSTAVE